MRNLKSHQSPAATFFYADEYIYIYNYFSPRRRQITPKAVEPLLVGRSWARYKYPTKGIWNEDTQFVSRNAEGAGNGEGKFPKGVHDGVQVGW